MFSAQIDVDDARIFLHLIHRAVGQGLALMQDGDFVGHRFHELHVVLDNHHGPTFGDEFEQPGGFLPFARAHAGHRFVQQQ
ncbi:hypothetical protein AO286_09850 [Pseudomonas syringae]|nr:hypothetical protein AO286_09850 [Pseudomonas syringae]